MGGPQERRVAADRARKLEALSRLAALRRRKTDGVLRTGPGSGANGASSSSGSCSGEESSDPESFVSAQSSPVTPGAGHGRPGGRGRRDRKQSPSGRTATGTSGGEGIRGAAESSEEGSSRDESPSQEESSGDGGSSEEGSSGAEASSDEGSSWEGDAGALVRDLASLKVADTRPEAEGGASLGAGPVERRADGASDAADARRARPPDPAAVPFPAPTSASPTTSPSPDAAMRRLPPDLAQLLYPHQREGVRWLLGLLERGQGGILADDMGLGKTLQVSAFFRAAFQPASPGEGRQQGPGGCGMEEDEATGTSRKLPLRASPSDGIASGDRPTSPSPRAAAASTGRAPAATRGGAAARPPRLATRCLVVAPKTLLAAWEGELRRSGLGRWVRTYHEGSARERERALRDVLSPEGGVLLTTYGMVTLRAAELSGTQAARGESDENIEDADRDAGEKAPVEGSGEGRPGEDGGGRARRPASPPSPLWSVIVLDEGHKIKNPRTKLRQALGTLEARTKIVVTGTPVQNNLQELHSLFSWAQPGLLGDAKRFQELFGARIVLGSDRGATAAQRAEGSRAAEQLRATLEPFILRRDKAGVLGGGASGREAAGGAGEGGGGDDGGGGDAEGDGALPRDGSPPGVAGAPARSAPPHSPSLSSSSAAPGPPVSLPSSHPTPAAIRMPPKRDLVVWLSPTPEQREVYAAFLQSPEVQEALDSTRSPLAQLTVLRKICWHPALLDARARDAIIAGAGAEWAGAEAARRSVGTEVARPGGAPPLPRAPVGAPPDTLGSIRRVLAGQTLSSSCKTAFSIALIGRLVADGHRTLVFSQSTAMLDLLQGACDARGWASERIDGSVSSPGERARRVERFQGCLHAACPRREAGGEGGDGHGGGGSALLASSAPISSSGLPTLEPPSALPLFFLTSQVGGLGLTLTAADRVIVLDPAWNPAADDQAVDRAYRIGQRKPVVVYRLVTCGTVEERAYRRQVFKRGLAKRAESAPAAVVGGLDAPAAASGSELARYFGLDDLRDLFRLDVAAMDRSETATVIAASRGASSRTSPPSEDAPRRPATAPADSDDAEAASLLSLPHAVDVSDHGALYSAPDASAPGSGAGDLRGWEAGGGGAAGRRGAKAAGRGAVAVVGRAGGGEGAPPPGSRGNAPRVSRWAGAGEVADLLSKMRIGAGGGAAGPPLSPRAARVASLRARVAELERAVAGQARVLAVPSLVASLPDAGAKVLAKVRELEAQLLVARVRLGEAEGGGGNASTSARGGSEGEGNGPLAQEDRGGRGAPQTRSSPSRQDRPAASPSPPPGRTPPPAETVPSRDPPPAGTAPSRDPPPAETAPSRDPPPAETAPSRDPPPAGAAPSRDPPPAGTVPSRDPPPAETAPPSSPLAEATAHASPSPPVAPLLPAIPPIPADLPVDALTPPRPATSVVPGRELHLAKRNLHTSAKKLATARAEGWRADELQELEAAVAALHGRYREARNAAAAGGHDRL